MITGISNPELVSYALTGHSAGVTAYGDEVRLSFDVVTDTIDPESGETVLPAAHPPRRLGFARSADAAVLGNPMLANGCPAAIAEPIPPNVGPGTGMLNPPTTCARHEECDDGVVCNGPEQCEPASASADAFGCRGAQIGGCGADRTCNEATQQCFDYATALTTCNAPDVAAAPFAENEWFAAAVVDTDCRDGQLRLGYFVDGADEVDADGAEPGRNILFRGDLRRSTSYLGLDLDADGCTGASRDTAEPVGAARPALASLDGNTTRRRPQALAAWLATSVQIPAPRDETPLVEIIGLWHEQGDAGGVSVGWVNASNDGAPIALDARAASLARPALVAVEGDAAGYVLGYGDAAGGVALRFVPAFGPPPYVQSTMPFPTPTISDAVLRAPVCTTDAECPVGSTCCTAIDGSACRAIGQCAQTACTMDGECPTAGAGSTCRNNRCKTDCATNADCPAAFVCQLAGNMAQRQCELGVCATDADCAENFHCDGAACVRGTPDIDVGPAQNQTTAGTVDAVALAIGSVEGATAQIGVVYVESGGVWFSRVTLSGGTFSGWDPVRLDDDAAEAVEPAVAYNARGIRSEGDQRGGWFATWSSGSQLRARRIFEGDGQPVEATPVIVTRSGNPRDATPFTTGEGDRAVTRVLFHSRIDNAIKVAPAVCGPPI